MKMNEGRTIRRYPTIPLSFVLGISDIHHVLSLRCEIEDSFEHTLCFEELDNHEEIVFWHEVCFLLEVLELVS